MANNHWGRLERGKRIVDEFSRVVRKHGVRAAIKLQFRDVDRFIHPDAKHRTDLRYVKKTIDTKMSDADLATLVRYIRMAGCIPMATPFDERSVDACVELELPYIKLASSDINDWKLIEKIAGTRKPVIASTGGSSLGDVDALVAYFAKRNIALAINHCVSLYPSEDADLQLNQIDFFRNRYPDVAIGLSTHEHRDWSTSIAIAVAKGARTFERHIDIEADGIPVSPYCTVPAQCDVWFDSFKRAKAMSGAPGTHKRVPSDGEVKYLDALVRGVYATRPMAPGHVVRDGDYFLAIPLLRGQMSCREFVEGSTVVSHVGDGEAVMLEALETPYADDVKMSARIRDRGIPVDVATAAAS